MLLFRAHDFVSGSLAHCFGHGGSRYTVLGSGDPVRNALPRHLLLPGRSDKSGIYSLTWASLLIIPRKSREWSLRLVRERVGSPPPRSPASAETIVGLYGSSTGGGRNKEPGNSRKMWDWFRRQRWIRSRGCRDGGVRSLTHPTRASVSLSSRCGTPDPCSLCLLLRLLLLPLLPLPLPPPPWEGKKEGDKRRREMAGLLDQIFNHRSAGWPGCKDEGSRPERVKQ